jgi:glucose-6-phosphate dehydrogenase assembly protein OpcA
MRPIGVDPAAIEDEFTRIWQSSYDESIVRLRVLNLVAVGRGDADAERYESVMQIVPREHPCRGILALTSGDDAAVEATISAHCVRDGDSMEICSEEVVLTGGRAQQRELASAVLALLVPEIPVTAWLVGQGDVSSYLVQEVLEEADALFADTGADGNPSAALRTLLAAEDEHGLRAYDLAWGRTETWRELIAQFFDGSDRLEQLAAIRSIEIRGYQGWGSAEPMLVAGWLVSRLGYSLADLDGNDEMLRATLYDGSRGVTLSIGAGWVPDAMANVRITTKDAVFEVQAHELSNHLHVVERWGSADESRRTVGQPSLDDGSLLLLGLDDNPDPRVYAEAAAAALALLGQ